MPSIFASLFLPELPVLLVWAGGLGLAVATRRRHPQKSLLVICALVLLVFDVIAGAWSTARLPFLLPGGSGAALGLAAAARGLLRAVAWVLILIAVFAGGGNGA